jgi:hypothetical protein
LSWANHSTQAGAAENDAERDAVVSVAKQFDAVFQIKGNSLAIGDFHSASDLVVKNMKWLEDFRRAAAGRSEGADTVEEQQLKQAQELIDEFQAQGSRAK